MPALFLFGRKPVLFFPQPGDKIVVIREIPGFFGFDGLIKQVMQFAVALITIFKA
jgi:hypothetical protein